MGFSDAKRGTEVERARGAKRATEGVGRTAARRERVRAKAARIVDD